MRKERVQMFNLSSAMGPRFAEIAVEMTEKARHLGPNRLGEMPEPTPQKVAAA